MDQNSNRQILPELSSCVPGDTIFTNVWDLEKKKKKRRKKPVPRPFQTMTALVRMFICAALLVNSLDGFRWQLHDKMTLDGDLTFSERYLWASQHGPSLLSNGDSYIRVKTDTLLQTKLNSSIRVAAAIFGAESPHYWSSLNSICAPESSQVTYEPWAVNVLRIVTPSKYDNKLLGNKPRKSSTVQSSTQAGKVDTLYSWRASFELDYIPVKTGWYVSRIAHHNMFTYKYILLDTESYSISYCPPQVQRSIQNM
jgi:hypothetical protein